MPRFLLSFAVLPLVIAIATSMTQPNILYLMADDMRPQLGCYGHEFMKTTNLDHLAATGLQFDFAYTNFAVCAPSRNSFLSGRRPDRTRALNFLSTFRQAPGGKLWHTMPQFFKEQGYFTSSAGKIFHDGMDDPESWTYPSNQTAWIGYAGCVEGDLRQPNAAKFTGSGWSNYCGITNESAIPFTDEDLALNEGLRRLDLAHASGKQWWVSIGVHRPHSPYRLPQGWYGPQIYPPGADDVVQPAMHKTPPAGVPYMASNNHEAVEGMGTGDVQDMSLGCPTCILPDDRATDFRRWYYAAVSYADHMLGKALAKLDELGETNRTITVFHADHGYHLGELNNWAKKTNHEIGTHVPLLIRVPWKPNSIGQRTAVKAELIDLYRTLVELAGFEQSAVQTSVQGTSLAPVFDDPIGAPMVKSKVAYSQHPRCGCHSGKAWYKDHAGTLQAECSENACCGIQQSSADYDFMGYSQRTSEYRFTAWVPWVSAKLRPDWSALEHVELYDLRNDSGRDFDHDAYSTNLAVDPHYASLVAQLTSELRAVAETWAPAPTPAPPTKPPTPAPPASPYCAMPTNPQCLAACCNVTAAPGQWRCWECVVSNASNTNCPQCWQSKALPACEPCYSPYSPPPSPSGLRRA